MFLSRLLRTTCLGGDRESSRDDMLHKEPVVLNVYDLVTINSYTIALGVGFFHSGVELYGREYGFGGHEFPFTGIFEIEPCNAQEELGENFRFRESILLGYTHFSCADVRRIIDQLGIEFSGNSYHLTSKNCNHFSNCLAHLVCGRKIPGWVNRLAYLITCVPFLERCVVSRPSNYPNNSRIQESQQR